MFTKHFTVTEANEMLPLLQDELKIIQHLYKDLMIKSAALKKLKEGFHPSELSDDPDPFFTLECELEFTQLEIKNHLSNIARHGVQIKNIKPALLDFPALIDGREVLLCWKQGEEGIEYYHDMNDGFAGRKKLNGDSPTE